MKKYIIILVIISIIPSFSQGYELWGWGYNEHGQLGDTLLIDRYIPTKNVQDAVWQSVSTGRLNSLGIQKDGSLWVWGHNLYGQLGDGTACWCVKSTPTKIGNENNWKKISASYSHCNAIKQDGSLWAWGHNDTGVLGNGTTNDSYQPTQVGNENNWKEISAGYNHCIAIKQDGSLWSWGLNYSGKLGDGSNEEKLLPTQIGSEKDWILIYAGVVSSFAIKKDGSLWSWGNNFYGQLGIGNNSDMNIPTRVGNEYNWQNIGLGDFHVIALKQDGSLWSWGRNEIGELGNTTLTSVNIPTQIGKDTDWKFIAAGRISSYAIKHDGSLWAWGSNEYGQLGDGTKIEKTIPTRIGNQFGWQSISSIYFHVLALKTAPTNIENNLQFNTNKYKISPNPVGEDLKLEIMSELFSENNIIEIYNILGVKVLTNSECKLNEGENQISINVRDLATGKYSIQLNGKNISVFIKD